MDLDTLPPANAGFLEAAGLSPPQKIARLAKQPFIASEAASSEITSEARSLLVRQRTLAPGYKAPEKRLRNKFSLVSLSEKSNTDRWHFTLHEVAGTVNSILTRHALPSAQVFHAVLLHAGTLSLQELWQHASDSKLQKRQSSRFRRRKKSKSPDLEWLDLVVARGDLEYTQLLCQRGVEQTQLDRALGAALAKHALEVAGILLTHGANASTHKATIREYFTSGNDLDLARLLLAVRDDAMSIDAWQHCLDPRFLRSSSIFLVCVAHCPKIISAKIFVASIETQNFAFTSALLAYGTPHTIYFDVRVSVSSYICTVADSALRLAFFSLLGKAGLLKDSDVLRQELRRTVELHDELHGVAIARTLVRAKVSVDSAGHNALRWAIRDMHFETIEMLSAGNCISSIAQGLDHLPDDATEWETLRLINILETNGLPCGVLDVRLLSAVKQQRTLLVEALLDRGASVEAEGGSALRHALYLADLATLEVMLNCECSREVISLSIPVALNLRSKSVRLRAMRMLTAKGVSHDALGAALRTLMFEPGHLDAELIGLILMHGSSLQALDNNADSCLVLAARKADLKVTKMMIEYESRRSILSLAMPVVYNMSGDALGEEVLALLEMLCIKGVTGSTIDEILLVALLDLRIDVTRLMIKNGANANHEHGAAFVAALASGRIEILQLLCATSPPERNSTESILLHVTAGSRDCSLEAMEILLDSSSESAPALDSLWPSLRLRMRIITRLLPCFIRHGLGVNHGQGEILRFAVEQNDRALLNEILAASPDVASLKTAFQATRNISERSVKLQIMRSLLQKARTEEIGQTQLLDQEAELALAGDLEGLVLLLSHKASVDHNDGYSVCRAAVKGNSLVLKTLLSFRPTLATLTRACLEVASAALDPKRAIIILRRLLAASDGVLIREASAVLAASVRRLPQQIQLPMLLLGHGAQPDLDTLRHATDRSPPKLVQLLLEKCASGVAREVFKHARRSKMECDRRYQVYDSVLSQSIGRDEITNALLDYLGDATTGKTAVSKLLLSHGADVGAVKGKAFSLAIAAGSTDVTKLLVQYITDDTTASDAFDAALSAPAGSTSLRRHTCRSVLQHWNVKPSSLSQALQRIVKEPAPDVADVELLLSKGADPQLHNASAFASAARAGNEAIFRVLSRRGNLDIVVRALIAHLDTADAVARWFLVIKDELPRRTRIQDNDLLLDCLRKYPKCINLLQLLLTNGASPRAVVTQSVHSTTPPEPMPFLLWAFLVEPTIGASQLSLLMRHGGKTAGLYSTPTTGVSAAFCCLLENDRLPLLVGILDRWGTEVESCEVPGRTLAVMGTKRRMSTEELEASVLPSKLPLRSAALYLGNAGAFRLLNRNLSADDGSLHLAAFMALPKVVKFLLETHDPNLSEEDFGNYIPLAVACGGKEIPFCKVANEEADFKTRLTQTIKLLLPKTNLTWRHRGMTVLHIALEDSLEATTALLDALTVTALKIQLAKCKYKDRAGEEYLPVEYVEELMSNTRSEKEALVAKLKEAGFGTASSNPWFSRM